MKITIELDDEHPNKVTVTSTGPDGQTVTATDQHDNIWPAFKYALGKILLIAPIGHTLREMILTLIED